MWDLEENQDDDIIVFVCASVFRSKKENGESENFKYMRCRRQPTTNVNNQPSNNVIGVVRK